MTDNPLDMQVGGRHYKDMKIQPIEFIQANDLGFEEGNAVKYLCRWKSKNGVQDLEKAIHYIRLLIDKFNKEEEKAALDKGRAVHQYTFDPFETILGICMQLIPVCKQDLIYMQRSIDDMVSDELAALDDGEYNDRDLCELMEISDMLDQYINNNKD